MSSTYQAAVEQTITAGEQIHQIVNGTATTEVTVEDGSKVPSIRKALLDNFYFKDPIAWQAGQTEPVFNQLRQFTDGSWWYAPSATTSNPISMGSTPVGDPLWKAYSFDAIGKLTPQIREALRRSYAEAGYNLVDGSFEAGGTLVNSVTDVLLYEATGIAYLWLGALPKVVPAGSTPASTGGIDLGAWVGAAHSNVEERLLGVGAKIYRGSNGQYVQNGDVVPAETTHLRVLINGKVEDVAMSPIASGAVSLLTDTSATIGVTQVNFNLINSLIFSSVKSLKHPPIQSSLLDLYDVKAKTTSYHGGWSVLLRPIGGGEYILTTKQKVRDALGDPTWEPDGYSDHYLFGGSTYVAMLIHNGVNNIQQFGAKGNNVDNDTPSINAACQKVKENALPVYAPGTGNFYLMSDDSWQVRVFDLDVDFVFFGEGQATKLKRGDGTATADFRELFKISNKAGSQINVTFKDMYIDDNARASAPPVSGYGYEHSHAIALLPIGARGISEVRFENLTVRDSVADACNVGGSGSNYVGDIIVSNVRTFDRTRVRSDVTVTCSYDSLSISNSIIDKFEIETNGVAEDSAGVLKVSNLTCRETFDVLYVDYSTIAEIDNLTVGKSLNIDGYNLKMSNSHINLTDLFRLTGTNTIYNSMVFDNVEFVVNSDFTGSEFMTIATASTSPSFVLFNSCKLRNPDNITLKNFWNDNNSAFEGRVIRFVDTDFNCTSNMDEAVFYRSGEYEFIDCTYSGNIVKNSYIRQFDAPLAIIHRLLLKDNEIKQSGKYLYQPPESSNGLVNITCKGNSAPIPGYIVGLTRYDKIAPPRGTGSVLNFIQVDHFESDGTPVSGQFIKGQRCYYKAPMPGGAEGVVATTSGKVGGAVVFKQFGSIAV